MDSDKDRPVLGLLPGADQPRLHGYDLVGPIGPPGLAQWWRATHAGQARRVAVVKVTGGSRDELLLQVDNANRLAHPGLRAPVASGSTLDDDALWFDFGPDPGPPIGTLAAREPADALAIARELTQAMLAFHALGRPVGDLRPDDVSFAMGRVAFPAMPLLFAGRGPLPGGDARATLASDQVAIGIVLAGLLTGRWSEPVELEAVPSALRSVVHRLIHRDPSRRYSDLAAVAVELETERRLLMASGDATFVPTPTAPRRRLWPLLLLLGMGGAALLAVSIGVVTWWSPRDVPTTPVPEATMRGVPELPSPPAPQAPVEVRVATPSPKRAPQPAPVVAPAAPPTAAPRATEPAPPIPVPKPTSAAEAAPTAEAAGLAEEAAPAEEAGPAEEAAPAAEPTPEPAPAAVPAPLPEPAGPDVAQLSGTLQGERGGRPLTLKLSLAADGTVGGTAGVQLGPSIREAAVSGTWLEGPTGVEVAFTEQSGPRPVTYQGTLDAGGLQGRWREGTRDRGAFAAQR